MRMWKIDRKIMIHVGKKEVLLKIIYDKKLKKIKRDYQIESIIVARVPEGKYTDEYLERYFNLPYLKKWFEEIDKEFEGAGELNEEDVKKLEEIGYHLEDRSKKELRAIIEKYVEKFTPQFGKPKQITIRPMNRVWGKCSTSKDKLTFNPVMKYIPEDFIEFIVYHEMIHTYCLNHNPPFYREMAKRYPEWQKWDYSLNTIGYLLSKNDIYF